MLSEDDEEEAIAGSEVGSASGSEVGMVRTVPDVSEVGAALVGDSASESEPPAEKLQASETSNGRMRARRGILDFLDILRPFIRIKEWQKMNNSCSVKSSIA
jgi:hypothetical protein